MRPSISFARTMCIHSSALALSGRKMRRGIHPCSNTASRKGGSQRLRLRVRAWFGFPMLTGRNRVRRLMRPMGISAVAPKPRTSVKAPSRKIFPHLLKDVAVTEPDQAWCADIACIPLRRGFMHLVAVMDWATRFALSRRPTAWGRSSAWRRWTTPCGAGRHRASSTRTKVPVHQRRLHGRRPVRQRGGGDGRCEAFSVAGADSILALNLQQESDPQQVSVSVGGPRWLRFKLQTIVKGARNPAKCPMPEAYFDVSFFGIRHLQ